jgi:surfeit locus 1 family protein
MRLPPLRLTRAGVIGTLMAVTVAAVCIRLGFWQLDRLEQRVERNRAVAERLSQPPLSLSVVGEDTAGLLYRRVELRGEYDHARSIVLGGRAHRGAPGVNLLTPLVLEGGGGAVLVNRGFVPSADAATIELTDFGEAGEVVLTGIVLPFAESGRSDGRSRGADAVITVKEEAGGGGSASFRSLWHRLDGEAIRRQSPYPLAGYYVQALPDTAAPRVPIRLAPPALDDGPHLGYAVQWFGFAAVALIGWLVLAVRRGEFRGGAVPDPGARRGPRGAAASPPRSDGRDHS